MLGVWVAGRQPVCRLGGGGFSACPSDGMRRVKQPGRSFDVAVEVPEARLISWKCALIIDGGGPA